MAWPEATSAKRKTRPENWFHSFCPLKKKKRNIALLLSICLLFTKHGWGNVSGQWMVSLRCRAWELESVRMLSATGNFFQIGSATWPSLSFAKSSRQQ